MNMAGVFRSYDIRGIYPEEIDDALAYAVGRAVVRFFGASKVAIGHDHRKGSPDLTAALARGIMEEGADAINLGFCPSPLLYNYNVKNSVPGIMVTASHNPLQYNGIKINSYDGCLIDSKAGLDEIEAIVRGERFTRAEEKGELYEHDHRQDYIAYLRRSLRHPRRPLKIVIDAGNATAGPILEDLFKGVDEIEVIPLFFKPDNESPSHLADPTKKENIVELSQRIRDEGADLGAAFDGDADRCIFLDERGVPIGPDIFLCIVADHESEKEGSASYFYTDVWSSRMVKKRMKELGCEHETLPLGAAKYKRKLILDGGTAAAEVSGHVMFSENYSQDDGFFALLKMIEYLGNSGKTVSALVAPYSIYFSDSMSVECDDPWDRISMIKEKYADGGHSELDGLTVEYDAWWFNVRPSNTEPLLRLKVEAESRDLLEQKMAELRSQISGPE